MAITTYSELKTAIANWMDDSNITSYIPDFITLCEAVLNDKLRVREMMTRNDAYTLSTSSRYVTLPTNFLELHRIWVPTAPAWKMSYKSSDQILDYYDSSSGKPNYYSVVGSELEFNRVPDSAYVAEVLYWKRITALSDSNTTNTILTSYPHLYLYGSMIQAEVFGLNDERIPTWKALFEEMIEKANNTTKRGDYGGSPLVMSTGAYTP